MSAEFPLVGFLQNCWFGPGTNKETIHRYLTDQHFRRLILARSMTGARLQRAFGEHYRSIWWDNSSVYVASSAPGRPDQPEPEHMADVLQTIQPRAVMLFGNMALQGFYLLQKSDGLVSHFCPHPNARGVTQAQLNAFAAEIISRYL